MEGVSIVLIIHHPDKEILRQIMESIAKQDYRGKLEVIEATPENGMGLAEKLNYGIKKAKYDIVVSLHQDCVPSSNSWLRNLVGPFRGKNVVATVSKVELPLELWDKFDSVSKILSAKEQKVLTPLLDEKGCAYRRSAMLKTGLFNEKDFRTAGEDFDMWLKLRKLGKIEYPDAKVIHYHSYSWKKRMKKELQLSNAFGALVRIYGTEMPRWWSGAIKAIPIIGWPLFLMGIEVKKLKMLALLAIPLYLWVNLVYFYGFWKGFLMGRQTI